MIDFRDRIKKPFPWKRIFKIFLRIAIAGAVLGFLAVAGVFIYFMKDLPDPGKINKRVIAESTKIYDRTGEHLLYEIHGEEKRTLIPFSEMPESLRYATISLEDQDFYSHYGIKFSSIVRAVLKDVVRGGSAQGGSTITQQFVKNSLLTNEKTLTRKIKEAILSIEIEQKFKKDEILQMYLNEIPYGSNAYGIEAAAQTFFGKHAKELTLDEATLLASLPKAPTYYSPSGSHPEALKARQESALQKMANLGYVTQEEADAAKEIDVLEKVAPRRENISAPHFVMYVKEYLEDHYGKQITEEEGLKVYTTLDWEKQQIAEKAVREGAEKNKTKWNAENASLVAIDPKTGQILAMVGSKDYFDKTIDGQVNVAIRDRQPGSSFKPYVYLTAFTKGFTPETTIFDVETDFATEEGKVYEPNNYDGKFRGPLKMKEALAQSLNIPAVKTLYLAGVKNSIEMAKKLGITSLNEPDRYGLSLVLGGGEVTLLDHTSAFATLANNGMRHNKTAILHIKDKDGQILESFQDSVGERVVDEKYIAMLDHIMSTNDYRAPVFGSNGPLRFDNRPVAAKTGTTNDWHDGWTMGYTPSLAVGVWAGNNNNSKMAPGADGSYVAAPIWRSFLEQALANSTVEEFPKYEKEDAGKPVLNGDLEMEKDVRVCEIPDKNDKYCLANSYCPDKLAKKRDFANVHTILYYVKKDDPRGDAPKDPERDPQFKKWEKGIREWYEDNDDDYIFGDPPKDECAQDDFSAYLPTISLSVPDSVSPPSLPIKVSARAAYGYRSINMYVNGNLIASDSKPVRHTYTISPDQYGTNISVEADITDKNGNTASDKKSVSVGS